jgi:hypothetical protein
LKSLSHRLTKAVEDGYKTNFEATPAGLKSIDSGKMYKPEELQVVHHFRFEGASDPADNSILYLIEAGDGTKGTLVDSYGAQSDPDVDKIIKKIPVNDDHQEDPVH